MSATTALTPAANGARQGSTPRAPSSARKNSASPLAASRSSCAAPAGPPMLPTGHVPAAVPSERYSCRPLLPLVAAKATTLPVRVTGAGFADACAAVSQ